MSDHKVVCDCCKKEFPALWPHNNTQAIGCAADIEGDTIIGHYGSTVADMSVYEFKNGRPPHIPEGLVCDDCIKKFIEENILEPGQDLGW